MKEIVISEVNVIPIRPRDGLVAFASCIVNSSLYLGNIGIYTSPSSPDGFRLTYPLKILPNGKEINCVHPINKEAGEAIKRAIVSKYQAILSLCQRSEEDVRSEKNATREQ